MGDENPNSPNFFDGKIIKLDPATYRRIIKIIEEKPCVFCAFCGCAIIDKAQCACIKARWN